jgi:3-isopropylmalate dehydrogenase
MYKVLSLPGDGVGPEVVAQAERILKRVAETFHLVFEIKHALIGGASIDQSGVPLSDDVLNLARESDAVLLGAVGGPKWDNVAYEKRPEQGLLRIREGLGLYANLRPTVVHESLVDASPLKEGLVRGTDILIVRELVGGIYFGKPKGTDHVGGVERGYNTEVYTRPEIERIAKKAFDLARKRRRKLCSVDKANILESSALWRRVVSECAKRYPDVALTHFYVDNCAMQLVRDPKQFDVIVTTNMFGDILSDEAAMLTGSIGMLPSASLGDHHALYEPVHGSAPDIAGKDKANPLAAILSAALMLRYTFDLHEVAASVERAVEAVLTDGRRTADLVQGGGNAVSCSDMGGFVSEKIGKG